MNEFLNPEVQVEEQGFPEPIAPVHSEAGTPFSELMPQETDQELWEKIMNGVQDTCDFMFKNNWGGAYIFRDGMTDRFFYQSIQNKPYLKIERDSSKPFPLNIVMAPAPTKKPTPEECWERIRLAYQLGDQEMGQYLFVRNKNL